MELTRKTHVNGNAANSKTSCRHHHITRIYVLLCIDVYGPNPLEKPNGISTQTIFQGRKEKSSPSGLNHFHCAKLVFQIFLTFIVFCYLHDFCGVFCICVSASFICLLWVLCLHYVCTWLFLLQHLSFIFVLSVNLIFVFATFTSALLVACVYQLCICLDFASSRAGIPKVGP